MKRLLKDKPVRHMKKLILFSGIVIMCIKLSAQSGVQMYDSVLARSLGADEYGMKQYIFVILTPGTNNLEKGAVRDSIFQGHRKNIGKLADSGKLVLAGPFGDNDKSYQGIFIFNVKTIAEAKDLLQTDPAIQAKLLDAELYEWYGSAAISEYLKIQKKITKKQR
jgi:uncharacterized protein YciI